jgi:hypothetical protein
MVLTLAALALYARRQQISLSEPSGPHAIGRVSFDWVDESRTETLGPNPAVKRAVVAWV